MCEGDEGWEDDVEFVVAGVDASGYFTAEEHLADSTGSSRA